MPETQFIVTVQNVSGSNKYFINGIQQLNILLNINTGSYTFINEQNNNHPLKFRDLAGNDYTNIITEGNTITLNIDNQTPSSLQYYCSFHAGMGGNMKVSNIQANKTLASNLKFNYGGELSYTISGNNINYMIRFSNNNGNYFQIGPFNINSLNLLSNIIFPIPPPEDDLGFNLIEFYPLNPNESIEIKNINVIESGYTTLIEIPDNSKGFFKLIWNNITYDNARFDVYTNEQNESFVKIAADNDNYIGFDESYLDNETNEEISGNQNQMLISKEFGWKGLYLQQSANGNLKFIDPNGNTQGYLYYDNEQLSFYGSTQLRFDIIAYRLSFSGYSWFYETTNGQLWYYNNEKQSYNNNNVNITDNGIEIVLKKENNGFTSSRIVTRDFLNGDKISLDESKKLTVSFMAKLPNSRDDDGNLLPLWPALWLLGEGIYKTGEEEIPWPYCGEIDVMEWSPVKGGNSENIYSHAIHWDNNGHIYDSANAITQIPEGFNEYKTVIYHNSEGKGAIEMYFNGVKQHTYVLDSNAKELYQTYDDQNALVSTSKNYGLIMNIAFSGIYTENSQSVNDLYNSYNFTERKMQIQNVNTISEDLTDEEFNTVINQNTGYDGIYLSGVFDGTIFNPVNDSFIFPSSASSWAGFANVNEDVYPFEFPNGGKITFEAAAVTGPVTIRFRFEKAPYPNADYYFDLGPFTIESTELTSYSFEFPPSPPDNTTFSSFLLFIEERDIEVIIKNVSVTEDEIIEVVPEYDGIYLSGVFDGTIFNPVNDSFIFPSSASSWAGFANVNEDVYPFDFSNGGSITFQAAAVTESVTITFRFEKAPYPNADYYFDIGPYIIESTELTTYSFEFPPLPPGEQLYSSFLMFIEETDIEVIVKNVSVTETVDTVPEYDGIYLSGVFDGTIFNPVNDSFIFPSNASSGAGFANVNEDVYPFEFPDGGIITFQAAAVTSTVNIIFRFEKAPYPNADYYFDLGPFPIESTELNTYSFEFPPSPPGEQIYSSFLMFIQERDLEIIVKNISVTDSAITANDSNEYDGIYLSDTFNGTIFNPVNNYFIYPSTAETDAGFTNVNQDVYPFQFETGGMLAFEAAVESDPVNIIFRFEKKTDTNYEKKTDSNVEYYFDIGPFIIDSTEFNSYLFHIPPSPPGESLYDSITMYIQERDRGLFLRNISIFGSLIINGSFDLQIEENTVLVGQYTANENVTWELSGIDSELFIITEIGELLFKSSPDFENPLDADNNNIYEIILTARNENNIGTKSITITVTDKDEVPPYVTNLLVTKRSNYLSTGDIVTIDVVFNEEIVLNPTESNYLILNIGEETRIAEYTSNTLNTITFNYIIKSEDKGILTMKEENLLIQGGSISDLAGNIADLSLINFTFESIILNDIPIIIGPNEIEIDEGILEIITFTVEDREIIQWDISGGPDYEYFTIDNSGNLKFLINTNFLNPLDSDGDNIYNVTISALDIYGYIGIKSINVKVLDVSSPSIIAINGIAGNYIMSDFIELKVTFNEPVLITGYPILKFKADDKILDAIYFEGNNSTTILFKHQITQQLEELDGISLFRDQTFVLNDATIKDFSGNDADLSVSQISIPELITIDSMFKIPGIPTLLSIMPLDSAASITWEAPIFNGHVDIDGYRIYTIPETSVKETTGDVRSAIIDNLINGQEYKLAVSAFNIVGEGDKVISESIIPFGKPFEPLNIFGENIYKSIHLSWDHPNNNGSEILSYKITVNDKVYEVEYPNKNIIVSDLWLEWGQSLIFEIQAINLAGIGSIGYSNDVIFNEPEVTISSDVYEGGDVSSEFSEDVDYTLKWRISKNRDMSNFEYLKNTNVKYNNAFIVSYSNGEKVAIPKDILGNDNDLLQLKLEINSKNYNIEDVISSDDVYYYLKLSPTFKEISENNFYTLLMSSSDNFTGSLFQIPNDQSLVNHYIQSEVTVSLDNNIFISNIEKIENVDDITEGLVSFLGKLELGETLIADISNISDDDGKLIFSDYQWEISNDNINYKSINGAISPVYKIPCSKIYNNKYFRVRVTSTDPFNNRQINYSDPDYLSDFIGTKQIIKTKLYGNLLTSEKEDIHNKLKLYYSNILNIDESYINLYFDLSNKDHIDMDVKIYNITETKKNFAIIINKNRTEISSIITKILFEYCKDINLLDIDNLHIYNYGDNTPNIDMIENKYVEINIETGCCDF